MVRLRKSVDYSVFVVKTDILIPVKNGFGQHNKRAHQEHERQKQRREKYQQRLFNSTNDQHPPRELLTHTQISPTTTTTGESQQAWLNWRANKQFVSDQTEFEIYEKISQTTANTCAGSGLILEERTVRLNSGSARTVIICKHVPAFSEHPIALSKLAPDYRIIFNMDNSQPVQTY